MVTSATLTFNGIGGGNWAGDILLTAYATQGTAFDPNKIGEGSSYGVIHVSGETAIDPTDLICIRAQHPARGEYRRLLIQPGCRELHVDRN